MMSYFFGYFMEMIQCISYHSYQISHRLVVVLPIDTDFLYLNRIRFTNIKWNYLIHGVFITLYYFAWF